MGPSKLPVVALEGRPVMATRLLCHLNPGPVRLQDADCPEPHVIYRQDI